MTDEANQEDASEAPPASFRADERKDRLLCAAERCFIDSGFHGARMAQIAKAASVSPGLIYHYFDSKEQIIAELIQRHFNEKKAMLARIEETDGSVLDAFLASLEEGLQSSLDPFWSAMTLEVTAEATRNDDIAKLLCCSDGEMRDRLRAALKRENDAPDMDARIEMFVALIQGLGIRAIRNPDMEREAVVKLLRDMVEHLFRRRPQD
ncbi:TetR/AcrR family transcriptional regulator [Parvularcula dongshanensis]|uniref:AcrR family transcriptional regulator n=1 Tax=Parvularcula dongshanensis TaxID=1173995 RepID=A0A840I5B6_9PROT|nr:TetR/AcrR family transcriptional regulator [Parvularcula dongshanensis]MBB4659515.1 AcrR family transcriptional regulator [Parvularcula dongshanensis]